MQRDYSFLDHCERGMFFSKKKYEGNALYTYEEVKHRLPGPIADARPEWVECYDYALKILFGNTHKPLPESGYVSNFVDAAFNADIFLWDTVFMTLFCNLLHPYVPGICSLDNFYCKQFADGEIPREMVRDTGKDMLLWVNAYDKPLYSYFHNHYGHRRLKELTDLPYEEMFKPDMGRVIEKNPYLTLDNLNHPLLAFAEWESYLHTGDTERLAMVYEPLYQYYEAMRYHLQHACGLYVTDWASMDNSTRNEYLGLAVDTSSEMVLFANHLIDIMEVLLKEGCAVEDYEGRREKLISEKEVLAAKINEKMWNEEEGFYYDLTFEGKQVRIKTIAGFFPLLAGVADREKADRLTAWLEDEDTFCRTHRIPVLAANEQGYNPEGGYWRGSVWAPTNSLVITGLEKQGYHRLAKEIAYNNLDVTTQVFKDTGTIWENYPADSVSSGDADNTDFVGWSGMAPIRYLIEYGIGLSCKAGEVYWELGEAVEKGRLGCRNYWFDGKTADYLAVKEGNGIKVTVNSKDSFLLHILYLGKKTSVKVNGVLEVTISAAE